MAPVPLQASNPGSVVFTIHTFPDPAPKADASPPPVSATLAFSTLEPHSTRRCLLQAYPNQQSTPHAETALGSAQLMYNANQDTSQLQLPLTDQVLRGVPWMLQSWIVW